MQRIATLFTFIFIVLCVAQGVSAQIPGVGTTGSSLTLSPQHPEPSEQVQVSLNDYSINTNGATISWFVNGEEVVSAANERTLTIRTGALGETIEVVEVTTLPSGAEIRAKKDITPVRVDMLIEADTLTPLFYNGRAIPSEGSVVSVTAIPFTGESVAPENYSYTWKVRDDVVGGGAQFGKNSISFASDFGKNIPVSVEIHDAEGGLVSGESAIVPLADPELHFYEINPLRGLSEHAVGSNYIFIGDEVRVRAEPYFLDASLLRNNPHTEWKLNGRSVENPSRDVQEITLRKQGDRGSFNLEFHIRNLNQLLQGVKDTITINF